MNPIISIKGLSKQYRLGTVGTGTLSNDLKRWWYNVRGKEDPFLKIGESNVRSSKGVSEYVWAIKDISFDVMPGEVLGIIGKNGAGKSTLLKILSKVTGPTTGSIDYNGRIGSLLEVGTGFHPELTGRENIFLNGAILGMTKAEIRAKLEEIVDFSGCERYIDTPVKRYSSGMLVRLGFAVAAHLDPEILVVDEVLAVGDAEFQNKAIGKMEQISRKEGRTVLFVSHNMASIKKLCTKGLVLSDGCSTFLGDVNDAINIYLGENEHKEGNILDGISYMNDLIRINEIFINNRISNTIKIDPYRNKIQIDIKGIIEIDIPIAIEAKFYDLNNILLGLHSQSHLTGKATKFIKGEFSLSQEINLPENMTKGVFYMEISLTHPNVEYLVIFANRLKIISEGIIGETGLVFEYKNCGFLML